MPKKPYVSTEYLGVRLPIGIYQEMIKIMDKGAIFLSSGSVVNIFPEFPIFDPTIFSQSQKLILRILFLVLGGYPCIKSYYHVLYMH